MNDLIKDRQASVNQYNNRESNLNLLVMFKVLLACLENSKFAKSASALLSNLAFYLNCERVSLGLYQKNTVDLFALSNVSVFDKHSELNQTIANAMEEAIEQQSVIEYPETENLPFSITLFHQKLSNITHASSIFTIPLVFEEKIIGALCFEKRAGQFFSRREKDLCKGIAIFIGPIIEHKRRESCSLLQKIVEHTYSYFKFGNNLSIKCAAGLATMLIILLSFIKGDYSVSAESTIEGKIERSIVAPFDGYLESSFVVPGDLVKAGTILGKLSDEDFRLEHLSLQNMVKKAKTEYRQALGKHQRNKTRVIKAQIVQARAKEHLLQRKLDKLSLISPFDGIVIEGDLRNAIGSPVEKGKILYKLSPVNEYRIILNINEEYINDISSGLNGKLRLNGAPNKNYQIEIVKITPVSFAKDKLSYFRVEAIFKEKYESILPGMTGQTKIEVGKKNIIWIWTRQFSLWLKSKLWMYLP
ncbi:HlyD family efflux transporter periplasmic adaptor subunit [Candidatus Berkiella cookevillensis]|uniref:HlyD family efflux transporter periplasmic adaptor subunit n=1 Tax=Candidatus Berkiella cookevillensis TaxID=437022 RepID=A0AAE3HS46_9GAMM|nr:HlyD family efflux transporter periplasmic adaptor subunit [Candidatus Berkiella cookevillensis]MCS5709075.1 HlyD family efflux transporter periplasmic adaptor subunit [Candidatus Berkiella cookevillensis]